MLVCLVNDCIQSIIGHLHRLLRTSMTDKHMCATRKESMHNSLSLLWSKAGVGERDCMIFLNCCKKSDDFFRELADGERNSAGSRSVKPQTSLAVSTVGGG